MKTKRETTRVRNRAKRKAWILARVKGIEDKKPAKPKQKEFESREKYKEWLLDRIKFVPKKIIAEEL